jgi:hypothetical protein
VEALTVIVSEPALFFVATISVLPVEVVIVKSFPTISNTTCNVLEV